MISDQEFLEIIEGLYEKTANASLTWQSKSLTYVDPKRGQLTVPPAAIRDAYWVQLPHATIEMQYGSPATEPDFINFILARQVNGQTLASRKVYEGDVGWDRLDDLYALVKRRDLGWDDVLKDVREFLGKKNTTATSSP